MNYCCFFGSLTILLFFILKLFKRFILAPYFSSNKNTLSSSSFPYKLIYCKQGWSFNSTKMRLKPFDVMLLKLRFVFFKFSFYNMILRIFFKSLSPIYLLEKSLPVILMLGFLCLGYDF